MTTSVRPDASPANPVPERLLCVQSSLGLWSGEGWVRTWGEAIKYPTGKDCVVAAEDVTRATGVSAMLAYAELATGA
jgi:hypothetical protein